ncbi:MAG: 2TM domain-containing protein [Candidatus Lokiarchaeota archaeon]|nr:2TM domain-containing protein [Candidatus Lokiarchaeota archaeon]
MSYNGFSEESLKRIAMRKVNFRMSMKIHIGCFIIVSGLLFTINLVLTPMLWWFLFPVLGWMIGVAEHITAYLVYARGVYPMAKRGVIFHFVAFIFTNLFLGIINFLIYPNLLWFLIPLIFWATGFSIHFISYIIFHRGSVDDQGGMKSKREKSVEKEILKMKRRMEHKE